MDKFEKVVEGLKHCKNESCIGCPYYNREVLEKEITCQVFDDAITLIGLRKKMDQANITTQQAVNHLQDVGWFKLYEEYIIMKKRLGLIKDEDTYTYENWH